MHIIHDRKRSNMHLSSSEGDRGAKRKHKWLNDKKKEGDKERDRAKDQRQGDNTFKETSDEEFNNSGETDHTLVVHLH